LYYKITENFERGKSPNIRAGNVGVDIQQVFAINAESAPVNESQRMA
jgi:hypothetical protein